jgi:hypothetical protein
MCSCAISPSWNRLCTIILLQSQDFSVKELSEDVDPATFACVYSCFALVPYKLNSYQARHTPNFVASATMDEASIRLNTVIRTCSLFASFVIVHTPIYEGVTRSRWFLDAIIFVVSYFLSLSMLLLGDIQGR